MLHIRILFILLLFFSLRVNALSESIQPILVDVESLVLAKYDCFLKVKFIDTISCNDKNMCYKIVVLKTFGAVNCNIGDTIFLVTSNSWYQFSSSLYYVGLNIEKNEYQWKCSYKDLSSIPIVNGKLDEWIILNPFIYKIYRFTPWQLDFIYSGKIREKKYDRILTKRIKIIEKKYDKILERRIKKINKNKL